MGILDSELWCAAQAEALKEFRERGLKISKPGGKKWYKWHRRAMEIYFDKVESLEPSTKQKYLDVLEKRDKEYANSEEEDDEDDEEEEQFEESDDGSSSEDLDPQCIGQMEKDREMARSMTAEEIKKMVKEFLESAQNDRKKRQERRERQKERKIAKLSE